MRHKALSFSLPNVRSFLINTFVFLGPLGNLFAPSSFPSPFRLYYLLLSLFPLFYSLAYFKEFKALLIAFPFLFYCLLSAFFTQFTPCYLEASPLFRFFLFGSQLLFVVGGAMHLRYKDPTYAKIRLLKLYFSSFFLSLFIGYILYTGFYLGKVSFATLEKFSVLAQFGYSILRFSPGSYPNEYGVVSSFVSAILTLLIVEKKEFSCFPSLTKGKLYLAFFFTFGALLLTTTRAAYLSYFFSCFYFLFLSSAMRRAMIKMALAFVTFFLFLKIFYSKILFAFFSALQALTNKLGSTSIRINVWKAGAEQFIDSPLLGNGFGFHYTLHNVYFQLLFELGIIGMFLLLFTLLYSTSLHQNKLSSIFLRKNITKEERFVNRVTIVGLIHILWFAFTNHNLNHHLTWFIFLLVNIHLFSRSEIKKAENLA